jgi:predicted glycogen debranching enzyme
MMRFGPEICHSLAAEGAPEREWLETNGVGGYASSTIIGLNTRRYHGLLVAATKPPLGRLVMLSKLEETLIVDGRRYELSVNQYPGVFHPVGYEHQTEFRLDPFPVFTYEVEGFRLEKSVFMPQGENTTVVQYALSEMSNAKTRPSLSVSLELRPLIAFRDYHSLTHENNELNIHVETQENRATIKPYKDLPPLHFAHDADEVDGSQAHWYRNFEYEKERERGLDFHEDLFSPFVMRFDLRQRDGANFIASPEARDVNQASVYRRSEIERREMIVSTSTQDSEFIRLLNLAADQYIVARGERKTVIAGYQWFGDWGRDTMIALPGLTLTTGRFRVARSILSEFARHVDRGMLPNRFPDAGEQPEYNTVDATLWYFEAVRAFLSHTNDDEFIRSKLYAVLTDIINWHVRGTRYNIRVDEDGLLVSGHEGVQLTWMDAKVGDWVVTPRTGKAVEIEALWYNALRIMEELAQRFGDNERREQYALMAERARESFNKLFWYEQASCLYDVVDGDQRDASIRPNQIFAASLPHSLLTPERAKSVVEVVRRDLLTPYGLRSLAPHDAQYRGRYEGDARSRDGAYHQGTVWAWLMGPFINAFLKTSDDIEEARATASDWLAPFALHLKTAGLHHISEIFDADAPHTPRGCIAQAWSVAELLRVAVELQRRDDSSERSESLEASSSSVR